MVALSADSFEIMENLSENSCPNDIEAALEEAIFCFGRHAKFTENVEIPNILEVELKRTALDYFLAKILTKQLNSSSDRSLTAVSRSRIFSQLKFTRLFYYADKIFTGDGDDKKTKSITCDFAIDKLKRRSDGYLDEEVVQNNGNRQSVVMKMNNEQLGEDDMEFEH